MSEIYDINFYDFKEKHYGQFRRAIITRYEEHMIRIKSRKSEKSWALNSKHYVHKSSLKLHMWLTGIIGRL